jgi:DNA polymerase III alpha subunit
VDSRASKSVIRNDEPASKLGSEGTGVSVRLWVLPARKLIGVPRRMTQHPGGFVLTHHGLDDLVPIEPAAMEDRQIIEWDKDDIDALKLMTVDVLGLGMLGCMNRAFNMLKADIGRWPLELYWTRPGKRTRSAWHRV